MSDETQHSITTWGRETFGTHPPLAVATRMNVEVTELLADLAAAVPDPLVKELVEANIRIAEALSVRANELTQRGKLPVTSNKEQGRECPDILIVLYQVASYCGIDLHAARDDKMQINRNRRWGLTDGGRFQHL